MKKIVATLCLGTLSFFTLNANALEPLEVSPNYGIPAQCQPVLRAIEICARSGLAMDDGIDADATQAYNKALEVRDYMRTDVITGNAAALTDSCTPGTKGHKKFIAYVQRLGQFQQQDNGSIHPKCAQQIRMMSGAKPGNF